ncbi:MAG: small multi-drug export protein [Candidatus Andersenbacteria bacterium]|nr:small multi-drug export protein [Candidatus Andersenbacteria bacterium]
MAGIPPALATILLAALPVGELRVALPTALLVYDLPLPYAAALSIVGNMLPVYFLLVGLEGVSSWARRVSPLADRLLGWLFARTRRRLDARVARLEHWALAIFVAIPLPATGAWTGALAAFVFGLPRWRSFLAILVGVCAAAALVAALTVGASFAFTNILR